MNQSKLFEWLLDNDCPFEWETVDGQMTTTSATLLFKDKKKEPQLPDIKEHGDFVIKDNVLYL